MRRSRKVEEKGYHWEGGSVSMARPFGATT